MNEISKNDALILLSKWERQDQSIHLFCFSPFIALVSKHGKLAIVLDQTIQLSFADDTFLRIFISEAVFSLVEADDISVKNIGSEFKHGILIDFPNPQVRCYLLASL